MYGIFQGGTSPGLSHTSNPEVIADLVELFNQFRIPNCISDPHPGKPVGLGKSTHPEDPMVIQVEGRKGSWRGESTIGFIQNEQAAIRDFFQHVIDAFRIPPASHRIIRIRDINQLRL